MRWGRAVLKRSPAARFRHYGTTALQRARQLVSQLLSRLTAPVWCSSDAASTSVVPALQYRSTAKSQAASLAASLAAHGHGSRLLCGAPQTLLPLPLPSDSLERSMHSTHINQR
ncbi:hypothetical protein NDU88_006968 [Pleurodeles waltl]|uniref:Uncharacterized protein n=1 Tax=Pleurodeles waltl TaxID=8319 RepID=A0AAV7RN24_PLEWA|nr:hypothetical protein NDU88_006968 [Pleurodeles waltl]